MAKVSKYQDKGFIPLQGDIPGGLRSYKADAVAILKGDALIDNGSGYVTNSVTDFASTFVGIAAEPCDNSGGSAGDLSVLVIPPLSNIQFVVPVDGNALITQSAVGTLCDLGADCGHIAVNDNPTEGWAFFVDEIDVSTDAIDAHAYGYAIGHLMVVGTAA